MRVLLITGSLPPMKCGIGDYTYELARALADQPNIHVGVLTSLHAAEIAGDPRIELLPVIKEWRVGEALTLARHLRAWNPDVVHVQYPTQGYLGGSLHWFIPIVCFLVGRPIVQTWHETYSLFPNPLQLLKLMLPTRIIVVRPAYRQLLSRVQQLALLGRAVTFIPNASSLPYVELTENDRLRLRSQYLNGQERLIVNFGFVYPHKGVDLLFDLADPARDRLLIVGEFRADTAYAEEIKRHASCEPWGGRATIVGFLPADELARLLAVADAVILPFRLGGGEWNTSIHGAVRQGTFVLTTSRTQRSYDKKRNVYYAMIDDVSEMKSALERFVGTRRAFDPEIDRNEWPQIARRHCSLYSEFVGHVDNSYNK